jgi:hypothetical protein
MPFFSKNTSPLEATSCRSAFRMFEKSRFAPPCIRSHSAGHFFGHQIAKISLFLVPRVTRTPRWLATSSCGILPHWREQRQDAAATSCEVNGSISRVFAVLSEVIVRQRLTVFGHTFFVPQISRISLFLIPLATRTPRDFVGWALPTNK